jgi:hemoglobin
MPGMYATLGGRRVFEAAVEDFYRRVVGDEALRRYFDGIELGRLKAHQQSFLAMALGGPRAYVGRTMASTHATLAITDEAFDRVLDHLVGTLADLGVASELIRGSVSALLALRHDIVRVPGTEYDREAGDRGLAAAARRCSPGPVRPTAERGAPPAGAPARPGRAGRAGWRRARGAVRAGPGVRAAPGQPGARAARARRTPRGP